MAEQETNVLVAIPKEDDYVWKISSEKIPHMTLLYLEDLASDPDLETVVQFLQHAISTSMFRFGLSVDRRGTLGPDNADVVFFTGPDAPDPLYSERHGISNIARFRQTLLQNPVLAQAYNAVPQFPQWTPHLTLGYPTDLAKSDPRDYPGVSYVEFDRIELWTADYAGITFPLSEDRRWELSMSDSSFVDDILAHHGIKGQKWGVRRNPKTGVRPIAQTLNDSKFGRASQANVDRHDRKVAAKKDKKNAKLDAKWEQNIYTVHGAINVHNAVADKMNNGVLEKLNADKRWDGMDLINRPNEPVAKSYMQAYESHVKTATEEAVKKVHGISPSGEKTVKLDTSDPEQWSIKVVSTSATHADLVELPTLIFAVEHNASGQITKMIQRNDDTLNQSSFSGVVLEHHGVKGMHWGVRKDGSTASSSVSTSRLRRKASEITVAQKPGQFVRTSGGHRQTAADDAVRVAAARQLAKKSTTDALSNKQLQEAVTRMNLEKQFSDLAKKADRRSKGQKFVHALLGVKHPSEQSTNGNTSATASAASAAAKQVAAALVKSAVAA